MQVRAFAHQTVTCCIEDMSGHVCLARALIFCTALVANQQPDVQHTTPALERTYSYYLNKNVIKKKNGFKPESTSMLACAVCIFI